MQAARVRVELEGLVAPGGPYPPAHSARQGPGLQPVEAGAPPLHPQEEQQQQRDEAQGQQQQPAEAGQLCAEMRAVQVGHRLWGMKTGGPNSERLLHMSSPR